MTPPLFLSCGATSFMQHILQLHAASTLLALASTLVAIASCRLPLPLSRRLQWFWAEDRPLNEFLRHRQRVVHISAAVGPGARSGKQAEESGKSRHL